MSIFRLVFFCALFSSHVHNILSALVIWLVHDLRLPWVISTHIFCLTILYNIRGRQISIMVYSHCIGTGPGMGQEPWKASVGFNGLERNDVYAFWGEPQSIIPVHSAINLNISASCQFSWNIHHLTAFDIILVRTCRIFIYTGSRLSRIRLEWTSI